MPNKVKLGIFTGVVFATFFAGWVIFDLFVKVPDFTRLKESVEVPIKLANGDKGIRVMGPKTANWTPLSAISEWLPRAVVSSEDGTFYSHNGIDVFEMQEAFKKDLKEGRLARGASTITQQVLKNVYLSHYPKIWRKVKEIAWAGKLEAALSKPQILAFYLNMAEWGPGIYGVGEASRHYFSVSPAALSPRQSAFLAMMLPSPRRYHAYFKEKRLTTWAAKRVDRILQVMNKLGQLPDDQYQVATAELLWGNEVLPDTAPGAPVDPGWQASESDSEVFEQVAGKLPTASPTANAAKAPPPAETVVAPPADPVPMDNPLADAEPLAPAGETKNLQSVGEPQVAEPPKASDSAPEPPRETQSAPEPSSEPVLDASGDSAPGESVPEPDAVTVD